MNDSTPAQVVNKLFCAFKIFGLCASYKVCTVSSLKKIEYSYWEFRISKSYLTSLKNVNTSLGLM